MKFLKDNDISSLEQYVKIHEADKEVQGQSLLYWAIFHNRPNFCKRLIEMGADINYKDSLGRSPLSVCCFFGFTDLAKLLLENNAVIDFTCVESSYYGWNGNIQTNILNLLREWGWINLYVDDLRSTPSGFTIARTVDEAISIMRNNSVHILSLDHDLGMDDKGNLLPTGYDLVKYICEKGLKPANKIYIHTDNVVGRKAMYDTLRAARRRGFIDNDIRIYHYPITENRYSG
jgi:ankyrin repeat protein